MNAVALDALKLARTLRERAQLSTEQAEGFASAIAEALQGDLATKGDLHALRSELRADQQEIRSDLRELELTLQAENRQLEQKLHGDMQQLEHKLRNAIEVSKNETLKWINGMIGLQTVAVLGALIAVMRFARV